jgi:hypothetical protein
MHPSSENTTTKQKKTLGFQKVSQKNRETESTPPSAPIYIHQKHLKTLRSKSGKNNRNTWGFALFFCKWRFLRGRIVLLLFLFVFGLFGSFVRDYCDAFFLLCIEGSY